MASDYPEVPLEEVADLSGGFAFKSSDYSPDGRFVLRTLNIDDDGSIHRKDAVFLPLEKCDQYKRFELQEHDTLFVMVGATLGKVGYVRRESLPALLNQNMWRIRGRDGLCDKRYLQYAFRHTVAERLGWASGSARDFVRRDDYRTMKIPVPPLREQKRIAHILGTLDDKIELNRRMNATLEAMARALFQSWFVDFDPVRRNAEGGESRPEDALFPDSLEDSEMGEIPKGWNAVTIGDVIDVLETGRRPKGGVAAYKTGVPSIGAESIWGIGHFDYSKTKFVPTEFYEKTSAGRVEHNDVLLYKDGGKPGEFKPRVGLFGHGFPFDRFCINEHVFRIRSKSVGQMYLYFTISDQRVLADFANKGGKAAIPGINQVDVRSTKILQPDKKTLDAFSQQVTPWCDLIIKNAIESRTLGNLRDELLPKLLSGELKIPSNA